MRTYGLTLAALALLAAPAASQPPGGAAPAPAAPAPGRLDELLKAWEQRMAQIQTLYIEECTLREMDKTLGAVRKQLTGKARYMRPDKVRLDLEKPGDPEDFERYIFTGKYLYEYQAREKLIVIHQVAAGANGPPDGTIFDFLRGMKAADAKKRYGLHLKKEDQHWIYLDIYPKEPRDKQDFTRAELVFYAGTMLPRRLWFEHPNGDETTWEFAKVHPNVRLDVKDFVAPPTPKGWKVTRAAGPQPSPAPPAAPMPPRVVRPQDR